MNTNHSSNGQPHEDDAAAKITAYALGQLSEAEATEVETLLADPAQNALRRQVQDVRQLGPALMEAAGDDSVSPSVELRKAMEVKLEELAPILVEPASGWKMPWVKIACGMCAAGLLAILFRPAFYSTPSQSNARLAKAQREIDALQTTPAEEAATRRTALAPLQNWRQDNGDYAPSTMTTLSGAIPVNPTAEMDGDSIKVELQDFGKETANESNIALAAPSAVLNGRGAASREKMVQAAGGTVPRDHWNRPVAAPQTGPGPGLGARASTSGGGEAKTGETTSAPTTVQLPKFAFPEASPAHDPAATVKVKAGEGRKGEAESLVTKVTPRIIVQEEAEANLGLRVEDSPVHRPAGEQYELPPENPFRGVRESPLSTFSIDVDTASYANVRRFLNNGRLPPPAAVRIEELVNYFSYRYPQPMGDDPFSVNLESAECPWQPGHLLLRVGLKGKEVHRAERPASNLVFLIDVSGSMADANKLPLLKTSLAMMAGELQRTDRVSMVVYAGEAGTKLDSVRGDEKDTVRRVIDGLNAGGSTHGSAGIQVAYDLAKKNFITGGVNRVIWATDGDLNVGITDDNSLVTLIKEKAASGVFLTVLGVGEGNLKDAKLEKLADNGNGMYAYLDSVKEARKVLIDQMSGSLVTIAKDVKLQIEFNPAEVAAYRLIGYENRILAARDFADDKKDAGEIGAGHTVTALYELVPAGGNADKPGEPESELKYQTFSKPVATKKPAAGELSDAAKSGELLTLKLRFKQPDAERSVLREFPLKEKGGRFGSATPDFQFAAAVAQFGMLLRGSQHRGSSAYSLVSETAAATIGDDLQGLRAEFVDLVRKAERMGK